MDATSTPSLDSVAARPRRRFGGWKIHVARTLLILGGLGFVFAALEVALRVVDVRVPTATILSSFFEYDRATGWRGRPLASHRFATSEFDTQVAHDRDGWRRVPALESPSSDDEPRRVVWCVGDSMVWGWGVNDGETLVDRLNDAAGPSVRFQNRGIPGYSSIQEYLMLRERFASGERPDQVILFFCVNDWSGNLFDSKADPPQPGAECVGGEWSIAGSPVPTSWRWSARSWLLRNSHAFGFLNYHYKRITHGQRKLEQTRREQHELAPPTADQQQALRFAYRQIQRLCDEHRVELVVATSVQAHPELDVICADLGIATLDLRRALDTPSASESTLTFAHDPHWTVAGHVAIAQTVIEQLSAQESARPADQAIASDPPQR